MADQLIKMHTFNPSFEAAVDGSNTTATPGGDLTNKINDVAGKANSDVLDLGKSQVEEMRALQMDMMVLQHLSAKEKLFAETASALSKNASDTASKIGSKIG